MTVQVEREVMYGRRAFPMAQTLLGGLGVPTRRLPGRIAVGWHETSIEPETGAFAVVADNSGLDDLVGEILRVSRAEREAYVYVLGARAVPTPISLTRRSFLALGLLGNDSLPCVVEVLA